MNKNKFLLISIVFSAIWQIVNACLYIFSGIDGTLLLFSFIPFAVILIFAIVKYGYLSCIVNAIVNSIISIITFILFTYDIIKSTGGGWFFGLGYYAGLLVSIFSPLIIMILCLIIRFIVTYVKNKHKEV